MKSKKTLFISFMVAVLILISWTPEDAKSKPKEKKGSSGSKVEKVVRIKDVEIKGEVKKPQAVFFLPRSKFTMDDMIVNESFIDNITNVVDKE
ncbi:MAG: hypothetical protein ACP5KG_11650 [Myxococcota bacterium]